MRHLFPRPTLVQAITLAGMALIAGIASNLAASSQRKLSWLDSPQSPVETNPAGKLQFSASSPSASEAPKIPETKRPTRGTSLKPSIPPKPLQLFPPDPASPVREIPSAETWKAHQGRVIFLDARRSVDYAQGHIPGAWCTPIWESDVDARITVFEATTKAANKDPIVLYCSGRDCEDSHMLASRLTELGYRNLFIYRAGYPDWVEHGRPVKQGEEPGKQP